MTLAEGVRNDLRLLNQAVEQLVQIQAARGEKWIQSAARAFYIGQFYTGLEQCLEKVLKLLGLDLPGRGDRYHVELIGLAKAKDLIPGEHMPLVDDLRGFRHFIRHAYGTELREDETREKAEKVISSWPKVRAQLERKAGLTQPPAP